MEGEPCVLRKQPLRRLRSRLYRQLLSWIQRLEPTPLDPASQPAGADDRAGLILEAVGGREAGGAEQRRAEAEDGARLEGTRLDGAMPMPRHFFCHTHQTSVPVPASSTVNVAAYQVNGTNKPTATAAIWEAR